MKKSNFPTKYVNFVLSRLGIRRDGSSQNDTFRVEVLAFFASIYKANAGNKGAKMSPYFFSTLDKGTRNAVKDCGMKSKVN